MAKKKKWKVLALDTSSNKTGWALFVNGKYAESGVIDLSKNKNVEDRIKKMCFSMPSTRNADTTRKLSRIIGAVFYYCLSNNINYTEMACATWRKLVGIKNSNRKKVKADSVNHVLQKYKLDISDDEADAINICEAFCIK